MLFTLQRYEFFSKSQRVWTRQKSRCRCCLPCKGTNFSANHNTCHIVVIVGCDVVYPAKVRIFQQITTQLVDSFALLPMLFTLQRYEFFSKSQRCSSFSIFRRRCCLPCKGTNFSANHNNLFWCLCHNQDVVYPAKVRIFQQITTNGDPCFLWVWMLFTLQRYEFFSKSQQYSYHVTYFFDVVYPAKVRIFQQITTTASMTSSVAQMLFTLQRYEFFSKSQLVRGNIYDNPWCCLPCKGTNFSANHN